MLNRILFWPGTSHYLKSDIRTFCGIKVRGRCRAIKGEGTTHICANCAHANLRPRPLSASIDEISMATNHARAENVTLSQQIGEVAVISASIFV